MHVKLLIFMSFPADVTVLVIIASFNTCISIARSTLSVSGSDGSLQMYQLKVYARMA